MTLKLLPLCSKKNVPNFKRPFSPSEPARYFTHLFQSSAFRISKPWTDRRKDQTSSNSKMGLKSDTTLFLLASHARILLSMCALTRFLSSESRSPSRYYLSVPLSGIRGSSVYLDNQNMCQLSYLKRERDGASSFHVEMRGNFGDLCVMRWLWKVLRPSIPWWSMWSRERGGQS